MRGGMACLLGYERRSIIGNGYKYTTTEVTELTHDYLRNTTITVEA